MLFANDHTAEDFQFGTDLLQQYIENNFSEFTTNPDSETTFRPKPKKRGSPGSNKESSMMNHDQVATEPAPDDHGYSPPGSSNLEHDYNESEAS